MTTVDVWTNGGRWTVVWHEPDDEPPGKNHGATAVCLTGSGDLVIVSCDGATWGLPGGRPEAGESWEDTMRREVWEEACAKVHGSHLLGFIHATCHSGHEKGLVLVRSQWRAEVSLENWNPEFEVSLRRTIPATAWRQHIDMGFGWEPIFARFFSEAGVGTVVDGPQTAGDDSPRLGIAEQQHSALREVVLKVASAFAGDPLVAAVWLYGSLGRDEGDELSDVDLVLVAAPGQVSNLVAAVRRRLDVAGDVCFVHEAPQNAPADGAQLNVLYDTEPLPIFVDWTIWPNVSERPSDAKSLFETTPLEAGDRTLSAMAGDHPRGQNTPLAERLSEFRTFMVPHLMKHAARRSFDSVAAIAHYMELPGEPPSTFDETMVLARSVLREAQPDARAKRTIERYLDILEAI